MAENGSNKINLIVVTPYRNFYEGKVTVVSVPSADGQIGIMHGHSPLVFALAPGLATIRVDDEVKHFVVSEGYAEINGEMALIVCNSAEWPDEVHVNWIFEAIKEAKESLEKEKDQPAGYQNVKDNTYKLIRAQARMHLIELYGTDAQKARLDHLRTAEDE